MWHATARPRRILLSLHAPSAIQAHAWLDRRRHNQDHNNCGGGHLAGRDAARAPARPSLYPWACEAEGERVRCGRCDRCV
eukprot:scaffold59673_cov65-Phaeocystis_antarctica.AAC.2